jgi:outer membrane protein assembly factor BamB
MDVRPPSRRRSLWRLRAVAVRLGAAFLIAGTIVPSAATGVARAAAFSPITVPLDTASPWPEMRHDRLNSGRSTIVARYGGDDPWAFRTGRGIFSTPVIGSDGAVYVGSGDSSFYALDARGHLRWRLKTGGLIDAAGALSSYDPALGSAPLTFGSADGRLYHVTTPRTGRPRILWTFRPTVPPVAAQGVSWWEGNVAIGPRGTIYAGNTGGSAYAVTPQGKFVWAFTAGNSLWTTPAFADDGSSYWGSLDLHVYRLGGAGRPLWSTFVPGYVVSSPAIGSDGTVYVGSFDSKLYALDPATGTVRWSFATTDHIYASPALGVDGRGRTDAIYVASTDGSVYALSPSGRLLWRYDTGDPIRSSPVLGAAPAAEHRGIVYVGSSNGKLYALDSDTGHRRWSFDTTPADPVLRDRNDLNASPALGRTGVYIAGEHGYVDYVPYDYCLHRRDHRCTRSPSQELGQNLDRVFVVTAGGSTLQSAGPVATATATVINLRLIVRRGGRTVNAAILAPDTTVHMQPALRFQTLESGDGHYLYVVPDGFLRPHTTYRLRVSGAYTDNASRMGNFNPAGASAGRFDQAIELRTFGPGPRLPLSVGPNRVDAITVTRLAVPMPAFLPSVNQIGFDSYDWIVSTIAKSRTGLLMWVIGAFKDARGVERVDPASAFGFPLVGRYQGSSIILSSPNARLQFSFGPVPLQRFELRGRLDPSLAIGPGASLFAQTICAQVPNYGAELTFTGICNPSGVLAASGTFISGAYHGSATSRPAGVTAGPIAIRHPTATVAGAAAAALRGPRLPLASAHVASILLTDASTGTPVPIDYRHETSLQTDRAGRIVGVDVTIAPGTALPARIRATVLLDAFPLAQALH